jgi:uncharacterized protein (DUF362 family)
VRPDRRQFLAGALATPLLPLSAGCSAPPPRWERAAVRQSKESRVAILEARDYTAPLVEIVRRGLSLFDLPVRGKTVVLKPNFVEFDKAGVINTHPRVVAAAIDAFRTLGARHVIVGEGPGHQRDIEHIVGASGLAAVLKEYRTPYVDLNYDEPLRLPLLSHYTALGHLYFPETILKADLIVSMPKLKTHHWAGVTLSMKNFFGLVPGSVYGWPKNALHRAGIPESIVDINSTVPVPTFAIVDGIVGMEGNGPIQGDARACGVLIFGSDLVAVDATAARVMTLNPRKVPYLETAGRFLGNLEEERIVQIGEPIDRFRADFKVLPSFHHLKS